MNIHRIGCDSSETKHIYMKRPQPAFATRLLCAAALTICALPATPAAARTLQFPPDRSLGMLYTLDAGIQRKIKDFHYHIDGTEMKWEYLGEAKGHVTVPPDKRLRLEHFNK